MTDLAQKKQLEEIENYLIKYFPDPLWFDLGPIFLSAN